MGGRPGELGVGVRLRLEGAGGRHRLALGVGPDPGGERELAVVQGQAGAAGDADIVRAVELAGALAGHADGGSGADLPRAGAAVTQPGDVGEVDGGLGGGGPGGLLELQAHNRAVVQLADFAEGEGAVVDAHIVQPAAPRAAQHHRPRPAERGDAGATGLQVAVDVERLLRLVLVVAEDQVIPAVCLERIGGRE